MTVLEISDYGTTGLDGKTRSSELSAGESSRFVRFIRNIGARREEHSLSGGTYGYGKSSLFALSGCETVLVDSVVHQHDELERRFMAARTGDEFHDGERYYTGRHWWGLRASDGVVEPVTGALADELTRRVGMPDRSGSTGTTMMIVNPDLGDGVVDLAAATRKLVRTLMWYFWPKMVPAHDDVSPMEFHVFCEGSSSNIPDPERTAPFSLFAEALKKVRRHGPPATAIWLKRPKTRLGWFAEARDVLEDRDDSLRAEGDPEIPKVCHHVALMRPAELVVKYLEGNRFPDERLEWGGVFVCSREENVEAAFAASEPPAHDDWVPKHLPGRSTERKYVNVALTRIQGEMERISPSARHTEPSDTSGFAQSADILGEALLGPGGDRPARDAERTPQKSRKSRTKTALRHISFSGLASDGDKVVATFGFNVVGQTGSSIFLVADPRIITEGQERLVEAPDGERPRIAYWRLGDELIKSDIGRVELCLADGMVECEVGIQVPSQMAITPGLKLDKAQDG